MPRLRNSATGAVVDVSEEYAERLLGAGWEAADQQKAPAKKAASSKSEK